MFSGWFGKKNKSEDGGVTERAVISDYSFLGTDLHSHILPGIDDGAPDMGVSLNMLRGFVELGYKKVITTPHVMSDFYPNTKEKILESFEALKIAAAEAHIGLELGVAAEYFIDENFQNRIGTGELLPIVNKEVLVEFSMFSEPPMLKEVIFSMVTRGYKPVIAHPERYNFLHQDFDRYAEFKDRGCLLQLNLLSVSGYYGPGARKIAEKILDKGLYDYCGSDAHHEKHLQSLKNALSSKSIGLISGYPFLNKTLCL